MKNKIAYNVIVEVVHKASCYINVMLMITFKESMLITSYALKSWVLK